MQKKQNLGSYEFLDCDGHHLLFLTTAPLLQPKCSMFSSWTSQSTGFNRTIRSSKSICTKGTLGPRPVRSGLPVVPSSERSEGGEMGDGTVRLSIASRLRPRLRRARSTSCRQFALSTPRKLQAVSYTHLTLPTKLEV